MITNDRQYKITKAQIEHFRQSLESASLNAPQEDVHPKLLELHKNAVEAQLNDLVAEVKEYEDLKLGKIVVTEIKELKDLPLSLIKARIANGLTQADLAEQVGMKMQQIQRYEAEKYESASLKTLTKIAEQLNLKLDAEIQIKSVEAPEDLDASRYPFKQMFKRKWFGNFSGSYNDALLNSKDLLQKLFENAGSINRQYSLTKKSVRSNSSFNQYALDAWYAHVLFKAQHQHLDHVFVKSNIDENWLRNLAQTSLHKDGPAKAANYLRESGIRFIIEPQLEGTFLDGAAMLMDDSSPIIALTLRYDRLDNFWFVLFHEIAHVCLHLSESLTAIFDDLDVVIDGVEKEADDFSLNALIPNETWRKSLVRFSPSDDTIINQAKTLKVHPALVAGRIRKETGKYYLFNNLIGQGEVRTQFQQELSN